MPLQSCAGFVALVPTSRRRPESIHPAVREAQSAKAKVQRQRHICEQQRADCSSARELFGTTPRCDRTMPRRKLQFQQEQAGNLLTSWGRGKVALGWGKQNARMILDSDDDFF